MNNTQRRSSAASYCNSIRNTEKKRYAEFYFNHLVNHTPEPNTDAFDLSYMAMQAVRMELSRQMSL